MKRIFRIPTLLLAVLIGFLFVVPTTASAATGDAGANAADFLRMSPSARATAQGEAFTARGGEIEALHYNPAGLARMKSAALTFEHTEFVAGINSQYIGAAIPLERVTLGISLRYLDFGGLTRRTITNPTGAGTFGANSIAGTLGAGLALGERFSVGLSVKPFQEKIDNTSREGFAFDLGAHYIFGNDLELGIAVRNLGPKVKFDTRKEELPREFAAGFTFPFLADRLRLSGEVALPHHQEVDYKAGIEFHPFKILYLRGGYNSRNDLDEGYSLGLGVEINRLNLDYSWIPFGPAGDAHKFSLIYQFRQGQSGVELEQDPN